MQTKNRIVAGLFLGSALVAQPAMAQMSLVDDLTTHATGNLAGQTASDGGTWQNLGTAGSVTVGTSVTSGNAAIAGATDGAAFLTLPTAIGASSIAATIFFQFDLGSTPTGNNINWSLENHGTATDGGGASANNVTELNANQANRAGLTIRNGANFDVLSADGTTVFTPASTLYDMWYVVNNSAKTYQLYMAGGALGSTPVLMSIATGAFSTTPASYTTTGAFRNPSASTAINEFVFGPGGAGNLGTQGLYDIYEDASGQDISNPTVPEPGTSALLVLSGVTVAWRMRRRNG